MSWPPVRPTCYESFQHCDVCIDLKTQCDYMYMVYSLLALYLTVIEFPTNSLEMNAVASIFDMNSDGYIDYYEFVSTLHPSRDPYRKTLDADQINEEVRDGNTCIEFVQMV